MFTFIDSVTQAGREHNEDLCHVQADFAFVLDGATPLGTDGKNCAVDFVAALARRLTALLPHYERTLSQCLSEGLRAVREEMPENAASASVLLVRTSKDSRLLEYLSLGDCTLLVKGRDGVEKIFDDRVSRLDGRALSNMAALARRLGVTVREAREYPEIQSLLLENRTYKNTDGGYWIADLSGTGVPHAKTGVLSTHGGEELLLMSDGFAVGFEAGLFNSIPDAFDQCGGGALASCPVRLEALLSSDPDFSLLPRFKHMDDSTAVYCRI